MITVKLIIKLKLYCIMAICWNVSGFRIRRSLLWISINMCFKKIKRKKILKKNKKIMGKLVKNRDKNNKLNLKNNKK